MPTDIPVCRICRCEGTDDAPLFHPCKCRGSIKYIHQECLESWLKHSHKERCDICNAPYTFKTVYQPDTPEVLPFPLIIGRAFSHFKVNLYHAYLSILTLVCIVIQVPVFVSCVDRYLDWLIGCAVPYSDYVYGFLYGEEIPGRTPGDLTDNFQKLQLIFDNTWLKGLMTISKYTLALGSMMLIQGSVLSDEGFNKIIKKKIGPEPRMHRIFDILHQRQLRRLNQQNENGVADEGDIDGHNNENNEMDPEDIQELVHIANRMLEEEHRNNPDRNRDLPAQFRANDDNLLAEPAMNEDINDEEAAVQNDNVGREENNGFFNGRKGPIFVLQTTAFIDVAVPGVLICLKTIPTLLGMITVGIADMAIRLLLSLLTKASTFLHAYIHISKSFYEFKAPNTVMQVYNWISEKVVVQKTTGFFLSNFVYPCENAYLNTINWTPTTNLFERRATVIVGFSVVLSLILLTMRKMESLCSQSNPLSGGYRSIYTVLLELVCVLKIFALVMIEWLVFPLFCGYQVEFALVPFFNENLYTYKIEPPLFGTLDFSYVPLWFIGTFFMYFFAAFVSMIRSNILREGVLFFIRPSDDPNIRLIHDALMRPFLLKLSHIGLSAIIYSLYIHIEFTIVTWGIRLFSPVKILPSVTRASNFERLGYLALFFVGSFSKDKIIDYWKFVFKYSCSRLRLSSFLLGEKIPSERGHVLYRNKLNHALHFHENPDFSNPVTEHEAGNFFKEHKEVNCCFVPDGNYVRAPDNDQVGRKFVRTLFVPVTKDDKLLAPIPPLVDDEEKYNPYGDEEPLNATTYTVVYRPPNFRKRVFSLFGLMWTFSMLITLFIYAFCIFVGILFELCMSFGDKSKNSGLDSGIFTLDVWKSTIAVCMIVTLGKFFDIATHIMTEQQNKPANNEELQNEDENDKVPKINEYTSIIMKVTKHIFSRCRTILVQGAPYVKMGFIFVMHLLTEAIILIFGLLLPGNYFDEYLAGMPNQHGGWVLHLYRVLLAGLTSISMNYVSGLVISINPRLSISFKIRHRIFIVSFLIAAIWLTNAAIYAWKHPGDNFHWLLSPPLENQETKFGPMIKYWVSLTTQSMAIRLCNILCFSIWIIFLLIVFIKKARAFFNEVNSQLKDEYYSRGKVLANASDDSRDTTNTLETTEINREE